MTAAADLRALDARIVSDALAVLRRRADEQETASRLYRVCEEAVAAREAALARRARV